MLYAHEYFKFNSKGSIFDDKVVSRWKTIVEGRVYKIYQIDNKLLGYDTELVVP